MSTDTTADQKRIARMDINPDLEHVTLGIDAHGLTHHFDATTLTVHVIGDGGKREARVFLPETGAQTVTDWCDAVAEEYGPWTERRWYATAADWLANV